MEFTLSRQLAERLRDSVREKPLTVGELRQIEKMDDMHLALSATPIDKDNYSEFFRLRIDGVSHACYIKRISSGS